MSLRAIEEEISRTSTNYADYTEWVLNIERDRNRDVVFGICEICVICGSVEAFPRHVHTNRDRRRFSGDDSRRRVRETLETFDARPAKGFSDEISSFTAAQLAIDPI